MMRRVPLGGVVVACAMLLAPAAGTSAARAAEIPWERSGPFQVCLATGLERWLDAQVDILTNEDPASWRIDDGVVAKWTVDQLIACKAKSGSGDSVTEERFVRHMAQWRRHIHDMVERVRQQVKPD